MSIGRHALTGALAALLAAAGPAAAHHSLTAYDASRPVTVTGEVTEFSFTHPHPYLVLQVKPPSGPAQAWRLEMDNLFELRNIGMRAETFRLKDRLTVSGSPDRNGAHALYVRQLERPSDGLFYEQPGMTPRLRLPNPK